MLTLACRHFTKPDDDAHHDLYKHPLQCIVLDTDKHPMTAHRFIVISGNIAVGKSTLTTKLAERLSWKPYFEHFAANPYLADFYGDMQRWSFHSQIYFLAQRLQHHHTLSQYPGIVLQDRSVYEDAEIFAHNLYLQGDMSERDYQCYQDVYNGVRPFLPSPDLVVYLQAPVGVLAERIAQRGRDYEQQISIAYLSQINELYETWAANWRLCPIMYVSATDYNFLDNSAHLGTIIEQIKAQLGPIPS